MDAGQANYQTNNLPITFSIVYNITTGSNQGNQHITNIDSYTTTTVKIFNANIANNTTHSNIRTWYIALGK